jgi:GNAT superfamily N-acetyltransferase
MDGMSLYKLNKKDINKAAEVFISAYYDYPVMLYVFPDNETRRKYLIKLFCFRIKMALFYNEVIATSPDLEGIIVRSDSNIDISLWNQIQHGGLSLIYKLGLKAFKKALLIDSFDTSQHKKLTNSRHLTVGPFAVSPEHQGKGFGSKLMRMIIEESKKDSLPIYLQTCTEKNYLIYSHLGFELIEKTIILDTEIEHWSMILHP